MSDKNFYEEFRNKDIALYIEGHRFPFTGKLLTVWNDHIVLKTQESDKHIFFKKYIVSLFEYRENKKFIESER